MSDRTVLITNDVETTSIVNHRLDDGTARYVVEQGLPRLLDLYASHGVRATFFFTGRIARLYPDAVRRVHSLGHEVGSHGLTHEVDKAFDTMPRAMQLDHLVQSKHLLEDIVGSDVVAFRAPALRVDKGFAAVLKEAGFLIDSSVASQRLDMFFSFGSLGKLNWLRSPRHAYLTSSADIYRRGTDGVFEVPVSAFAFPYIGTFMRIAPLLNRTTRRLLHLEAMATGRQFVFLTHPNEFIDEPRDGNAIDRRAKSWLAYLMGDLLRHALKVRNLGAQALPLLEHELAFFDGYGYKYHTCSDLYNQYLNTHAQ
ncbi:MAG: polysaccharide deacetylase family protein [Bacteroidales bacterium]|nr:polysaccharide deacetylase family protein [Bacteroidales bacterium]